MPKRITTPDPILRVFVNEYLSNGYNAKKAAEDVFGITNTYAAMKGHILMKNERVQAIIKETLADLIPDEFVIQKHMELFNQKQIDYFTFPPNMEDEEIIEHVQSNGLKLINIRPTRTSKIAYYSVADTNALKSAIDMTYKLKGVYKNDPRPIDNDEDNIIETHELQTLAKKINALTGNNNGNNITSDGTDTNALDEEA